MLRFLKNVTQFGSFLHSVITKDIHFYTSLAFIDLVCRTALIDLFKSTLKPTKMGNVVHIHVKSLSERHVKKVYGFDF